MTVDLAALLANAELRIAEAIDLDSLKDLESEVTGKKSDLASAQSALGALDPAARRDRGKLVNETRQAIEAAIASRRETLAVAHRTLLLEADRLDLTEVVGAVHIGRSHVVTQASVELEDIFIGMGFSVSEGPEIETDWNNFEALNFPPGHPARDMQDTFIVDWNEPGSTVLRTHTSPVQVRQMTTQPLPIYTVVTGLCHRVDTPDARHLAHFHQIEGLVVDEGITFGDLAGAIDTFVRAYLGDDMKTRLRPASFPFTEPSGEVEISCPFCRGKGCRTCSQVGWIELGGCGMVHPTVLENCDIDSERYTGWAFGFGYDRLAMMRHNIDDLRNFIDNDVRFLRQF